MGCAWRKPKRVTNMSHKVKYFVWLQILVCNWIASGCSVQLIPGWEAAGSPWAQVSDFSQITQWWGGKTGEVRLDSSSVRVTSTGTGTEWSFPTKETVLSPFARMAQPGRADELLWRSDLGPSQAKLLRITPFISFLVFLLPITWWNTHQCTSRIPQRLHQEYSLKVHL